MNAITTELISCRTDDGIDLAGTLFLPGGEMSSTAIALFPGTGAEFYQPLFARLCPMLARAGYATLAMNRRDHGQFFGYFPLHDAAMDQRLGLDLLEARGAKRIVLGGHSYGTVTAPYYVAETGDPRVAALLLYAALGDLRAVPTELIRHVGDRPLLAFRDPSDPFPATLPPAQQELEAANPNLRYILLEDQASAGLEPSRHHFEGREAEIAGLTLQWLAETGLHPT